MIVIMMGTNYGDPKFWSSERFKRDYISLIKSLVGSTNLQDLNTNKLAKVYLCTPPPLVPYYRYGIVRSIINDEM